MNKDALMRSHAGSYPQTWQSLNRIELFSMLRFSLITALVAAGCSSPMRYVADLRQEQGSPAAPVIVTIGPLQYSTDVYLSPGWFRAEPFQVLLVNQTDEPVLVDWDRSALVTPSGETLRIIHRGVAFADAKAGNYQTYQKQSLIAPRAKLTDVIVPVAWLYWIMNEWRLCVVPTPDSRFVVSLTFDVGGKSITLGTPFIIEEGRRVAPTEVSH